MRSEYPFFSLLSRSSPWVSLCLSCGVYMLLWKLVPYFLRDVPMFAPLSRLAVSAAPLMAAVFLLPLPLAVWRASRERRLVRKMASIEALRAMRWDELEMVVRRLFEQHGYAAERVGGAGADGGVDVILRKAGRTLLVQCKQWNARQVSVNVVRELAGVVVVHGADGGIVVTCGVFTKEARSFASRSGIVLVDGLELLRMRGAAGVTVQASTLLASGAPVAPEATCGCPKCGSVMVRRSAKGGDMRRQFLGCSNYPACRGTRPL